MSGPSVYGRQAQNSLFSIIILCWNSNRFLYSCLQSLDLQTCKDFEILIVDNGSPEPISTQNLMDFPNLSITFFSLEHNRGFAAGNNLAASHAEGKYLVLLNADAFPTPGWLEAISNAIHKYPHGFFASKLVMANDPDRLDGTGDVYHASGVVWRKSYNTLATRSSLQEKEVFSACGAAAVYPIEAFKQVDGFDADYFSYVEDVDLGFRLRLVGYQCVYLPDAVVYHLGSGSTSKRSDLSVYYGQRNLVWTFYKDMPGVLVWVLTPLHLFANFLIIILAILRKQGAVTIRAKKDAFLNLPTFLKKRKIIQHSRRISVFKLMGSLDWNPISPILKLVHK